MMKELKHGYSRYNKGCRCETCKTSNREYHEAYRKDHPGANSGALSALREKRRREGICVLCGKRPRIPESVAYCAECREKKYRYNRESRGGKERKARPIPNIPEVIALYEEGAPIIRIADKIGITTYMVNRIITQYKAELD